MKKYILFAALAAATLFWDSCQKKKSEETTYNINGKNALFSDLRYEPQRFTVEAGRDTTIFSLDSNTVINFYPQTFRDANDNVFSKGMVGIELIEMYEPGDMILNRATTEASGNKILQSSGQVRIKASMNGKELFANVYGIGFKVVKAKVTGDSMSLFYGNTNNEDSVVTWTQSTVNLGTRSVPTVRDSTAGPGSEKELYYFFDSCASFEFVNCDRYFGLTGVETSIAVDYDTKKFSRENTSVFLSLPEINGVVPFRPEYNLKYPLGMKYVLVILAKKDGNYYFDMQSGTITENMRVKMNPYLETRFNIKARLGGIM
ncbi:MAG: hypothetical protein IAE95_02555 [Chitinophagaceae bacterium]|nr:hypothetical protein [Chitinophagaceae bacterium]